MGRSLSAIALLVFWMAFVGCYHEGKDLPPEISAISISVNGSPPNAIFESLREASGAGLVADLPQGSDYHQARIRKFVDVEVLDLFSILTTIFDAVRQTHHSEAQNIARGWYKCLVAFNDEGDGEGNGNATTLQEWYVKSDMTYRFGGGKMVNVFQAKIVEMDDGVEEVIRVEGQIRTAPTLNDDGSLADTGDWDLRASFGPDENPDGFFHATSEILENGMSRITINEHFVERMGPPGSPEIAIDERAILVRSADAGYGVAEYPDFDVCWNPASGVDCENGPPMATVQFAYNDRYLSVQLDGGDMISFDRHDDHEITHRYQLYTTGDGRSVDRAMNFGFPVITDSGSFGWYGAWQDRHELWVDGEPAADGMTVTREGAASDEIAPTYTVKRFSGTLTRVGLVEGGIDQVADMPIEIHLFDDFRLVWDSDAEVWNHCRGMDESTGGCLEEGVFDRFDSLVSGGPEDRRHVWINGCIMVSETQWTCDEFVYVPEGEAPGFYYADFNFETGMPESNGTLLELGLLEDGTELWVGIGGQSHIQYTGEFSGPTTTTGWVEKSVVDFDEMTWTPVFDDAADREFGFELGREYNVNKRGVNLRVTRVAELGSADDYSVFMEIHRVAKPVVDMSDVYVPGTRLENGWDPDFNSKFVFNTDPESPNYLLLEYAELSEQDENDGHSVGDVVQDDRWGLRVEGDTTVLNAATVSTATLFNWEFKGSEEMWGGVTYLVDADSNYVLLDQPLHFDPIALPTTDDLVNNRSEEEWLSYSLVYDGWLHGLPDAHFELERAGADGADVPEILANNVRIPDGLILTADTGDTFHIRGLDVGVYLGVVEEFANGTPPDLASAAALDLDAGLPLFEAPDMDSALPLFAPLLYVEGKPVE